MKITKIKTSLGQFGSPVTTELSVVVERMRSPQTKEAADRIASIALRSRIAMEEGAPRYQLNDTDKLPYLVFSATFGRRGYDNPASATGLLMLNVPCPQGFRQVEELRRRVSQIPYTMLAFAGVSGVTLKVIVKCDYKDGDCKSPTTQKAGATTVNVDDYLAFLKDAHESAARLYTSLVMCDAICSWGNSVSHGVVA